MSLRDPNETLRLRYDGDLEKWGNVVAARVWCEESEDLMTLLNGAYIMTLCYDRSTKRVSTLNIQLRGCLWGFGVWGDWLL